MAAEQAWTSGCLTDTILLLDKHAIALLPGDRTPLHCTATRRLQVHASACATPRASACASLHQASAPNVISSAPSSMTSSKSQATCKRITTWVAHADLLATPCLHPIQLKANLRPAQHENLSGKGGWQQAVIHCLHQGGVGSHGCFTILLHALPAEGAVG